MKQTFGFVSPLIESQFPAFYREEGPLFVQFVKSYYEWLEETDNPLYYARNLLAFADIDTTLDQFLPYFQSKYLAGITLNGVEKKRDLIKHALEIHRTKGTIQSLRLLFRLIFDEDIEVYYPGDDILRASDGRWVTPIYLELSPSDKAATYVNKDIRGLTSGATAFVERVVRRNHRGAIVDVAYLSNVRGDFQTDELVTDGGSHEESPRVIGSLTSIELLTTGNDYEVGEILDVVSARNGKLGKARVANVGIRTGEVNYQLIDGGFGYTLNANVYGVSQKVFVSSNVLSYAIFTSNTNTVKFEEFTQLRQPLINVSFSSANVQFANGSLVYGVNSSSGYVTAGFILQTNQSGNTGWLLISPHAITNVGIDTVTNANTTSGSYNQGEIVYQTSGGANTALGIVVYANSTSVTIDERFGPFQTNQPLIGRESNCQSNTASVSALSFNNTNFSNASVVTLFANATTNGATIGTKSDITAVANVVGSNNQAVGVFTITNQFYSLPGNFIYEPVSNSKATVTLTSTGSPGGFKIGAISNTELIYVGADKIGSNNTGNVAFLSVTIDSLNSNVAGGYGFPRLPSANLSSPVGSAFTNIPLTVGSILSLTERNPGSNNSAAPFVVEIEPAVATYGKYELVNLTIQNPTGIFRPNELITQTLSLPMMVMTVNSVSGTFDTVTREMLKQVRSDGVTVYGEAYQAAIVGANGTIRILVSDTANTFNTSNTIVGMYSGATATPITATANSLAKEIRAFNTQSNSSLIVAKRASFTDFQVGVPIVGSESGSSANVIFIDSNASSNIVGNNAIVSSLAASTNGTISSVEVIDSGYTYQDGEEVILTNNINPATVVGVVRLGKQGEAEGYWEGDYGFLSGTKVVQDNYYYQEFAYEIQSGLDQTRYENIVKETTHVAGTKMFSSFNKKTVSEQIIDKAQVSQPVICTFVFSAVGGTFPIVGDRVVQFSGANVTATSTVMLSNSGINTVYTSNVVGTYDISQPVTIVYANTANVSANVTSLNIQLA